MLQDCALRWHDVMGRLAMMTVSDPTGQRDDGAQSAQPAQRAQPGSEHEAVGMSD